MPSKGHSRARYLPWVLVGIAFGYPGTATAAADGEGGSIVPAPPNEENGGDSPQAVGRLVSPPTPEPGAARSSVSRTPELLAVGESASALRRRGVRNLAEYLHMEVPAFNLSGDIAGGWRVGVRGETSHTNSRIAVVQDGIPINQRLAFGLPGAAWGSPLLGDLEHVRGVAGPSAGVWHDSAAASGTVHLTTATGKSRPGIWFSADRTSGRGYRAEMSYGFALQEGEEGGGGDFFFYVGVADAGGAPVRKMRQLTDAERQDERLDLWEATSESRFRGMQRVGQFLHPHVKSALLLRYGTEASRLRGRLLARFSRASMAGAGVIAFNPADATEFQETVGDAASVEGIGAALGREHESMLLSPAVTIRVGDHERVDVVGAWRTSRTDQEPAHWLSDQLLEMNVSTHEGRIWWENLSETERSLKAVATSQRLPHTRLSLGAEAAQRGYVMWSNLGPDPAPLQRDNPGTGNYNMKRSTVALFGRAQVDAGPASVFAGLRYERAFELAGRLGIGAPGTRKYRVFSEPTVVLGPSVVAVWQPGEAHILKAGYQVGFRYPDAASYKQWTLNRESTDPAVLQGGNQATLEPETSHRLSLSYQAQEIGIRGVSGQVVLGYAVHKNSVQWQRWSSGVGAERVDWASYANQGADTAALSADAGLSYAISRSLAQLWYSYSQPRGGYDGTDVPAFTSWDGEAWRLFPSHLLKLRLSQQFDDFTVSATARWRSGVSYRGTRDAPLGDGDPLPLPYRSDAKQEFLLNAAVSYRVRKGIEISAFIKNATLSRRRVITDGLGIPAARRPFVGIAAQYILGR